MIKKMTPFVGQYKKSSIITILCVAVEVVCNVTLPYLMALIIDQGIAKQDMQIILNIGAIMVAVSLFSLFFGITGSKNASIASTGFAKNVRSGVFEKIQKFSFKNTDKFTTPSLITRLTYDIHNLQISYMLIIRMLVRAPLMLISATTMALLTNVELAVVFAFTVPFLATALYLIISKALPHFKKMFKKYDKMNARVQENLVGIRVVKSFTREDYEIEKFKQSADEVKNLQLKAEKIVVFLGPIMQFTMNASIIALIWLGGNMVVMGGLKTGELMSFISYSGQILMSLMMISRVFVMLTISRASLSRVVEVLDEKTDITDEENSSEQLVESGDITMENVHFSYSNEGEKDVLSKISFHINSGEVVGIIGATGSAKTSLVQLIPRLYDATKGKVSVGGVDVKKYNLKNLRSSIGMVLQKNVLFSGTIKENLKWGNENASDEQIENACKIADAHDFVTSFKDKYDTVLTQGATNLSGGQKQRLCIARALLKNPKILILDDSTSAVDTATDKKIKTQFSAKIAGTTVIIIAQRITSVMHADKIIVLNNGKVDQIGTHSQLLKENEIYKDIFNLQQTGGR